MLTMFEPQSLIQLCIFGVCSFFPRSAGGAVEHVRQSGSTFHSFHRCPQFGNLYYLCLCGRLTNGRSHKRLIGPSVQEHVRARAKEHGRCSQLWNIKKQTACAIARTPTFHRETSRVLIKCGSNQAPYLHRWRVSTSSSDLFWKKTVPRF